MAQFSPYPLCAIAAISGGALRLASPFLDWSTMTPSLELFALVIDFSLLFGLAGFYFANAGRLGVSGFLSSFIAALGLASITGPDGVFYGIDVYQAGAQVIGIGLLFFGVVLIAKNIARLAGRMDSIGRGQRRRRRARARRTWVSDRRRLIRGRLYRRRPVALFDAALIMKILRALAAETLGGLHHGGRKRRRIHVSALARGGLIGAHELFRRL